MKAIIAIEKNRYLYDGNEYSYEDYYELLKKTSKYRKILILGEELLIKIYSLEKKFISIEKFIEDTISREFSTYNNLLFSYEYIKKDNSVYIYSVKRGYEVEKISIGAKELKIEPVQFLIKDIISRRGKKEYIAISKVRGLIYIIKVKDDVILYGEVKKDLLDINNFIEENKSEIIIIDKNLKGDISIGEVNRLKYINIGEKVNEKLFSKQRFYSKKFYSRKKIENK